MFIDTRRLKRLRLGLFILNLFLGLGACAGGFAAITQPSSPMGIPPEVTAEMLGHSPFTDFFIPGLILFGFLGLGNLFCAMASRLWPKSGGYLGFVWGCGMMIWIIVQCFLLLGIGLLHVIFFILGAIQAVLGLLILYEEDYFPFNLIL